MEDKKEHVFYGDGQTETTDDEFGAWYERATDFMDRVFGVDTSKPPAE